jgi:hypothetical protein
MVDGPRPCPSQNQSRQGGQVEKIGFISGLTKMGARGIDGLQFDGAEAIGKMNRENGDK